MESKTDIWQLGSIQLFKGMPDETVKEVEEIFTKTTFDKREVVLDPSMCCNVYIVKQGSVEIYSLTAEGKKIIIDVLKPGSIFADYGGAFSSGVFVEAIENSVIYTVEKEAFFKAISKEPVLAERFMRHLFNRLMRMEHKSVSLAADSVLKRFAKLLLSLGKEKDSKKDRSVFITDAYTHEQLAQMIGVSRQTLTSLINQLEKQELIERDRKHFMYNPRQIRAIAE